jgi:hypothetical protein
MTCSDVREAVAALGQDLAVPDHHHHRARDVAARPPTDYALPGIYESDRVQFNEAKICSSDGITCW